MKNFFNRDDFPEDGVDAFNHRDLAAIAANVKLRKYLESCPVVHSFEGPLAETWGAKNHKYVTHTARLAFIEPIKCQHVNTKIHEPHLAGARKCLDCGYEKLSASADWQPEACRHEPRPFRNGAGMIICVHCKVELEAEWKPKK